MPAGGGGPRGTGRRGRAWRGGTPADGTARWPIGARPAASRPAPGPGRCPGPRREPRAAAPAARARTGGRTGPGPIGPRGRPDRADRPRRSRPVGVAGRLRAPALAGRRAEPDRPGDGAVRLVGREPAPVRVALVLLRAAAAVARRSAGRLRADGPSCDYRRSGAGSERSAWSSAIGLLMAVLVPGVGISVSGSSRWLGVGSWRIQPSELAKLALVLFAADVLDRRADRMRGLALQHGARRWSPSAGGRRLVMLQPDMGTTMVLGVHRARRPLRRRGPRSRSMTGVLGIGAVPSARSWRSPPRTGGGG